MTDVATSLLIQAEAREERLRHALEAVLTHAEVLVKGPDMQLSSRSAGRELQQLIRSQLAERTPAG